MVKLKSNEAEVGIDYWVEREPKKKERKLPIPIGQLDILQCRDEESFLEIYDYRLGVWREAYEIIFTAFFRNVFLMIYVGYVENHFSMICV
jgi:hypothetical protein